VAKGKEAKSAEELLRFVEDLKRQWMSTIDALVDPLMIVGKDYKVRKANLAMARMAGIDVKDINGRSCYEVFANRKTPCPGCAMRNAAKTKRETTFHLEDIRGDRYFEVSSQPLIDGDGDLDGIVQVYRDRTDAKRMQEQLAQQEKLASIGLLAGGVAHEINNPLGGILIFSQMLLREMDKTSSHYADVVEIEAATQRCKAIVESLLDFARQNPAGKKAKPTHVNAIEAIRTAIRFGTVAARQGAHVDIEEKFEDEAHVVRGDRNRLVQLFLNLIQNGLQAMPDGGTLIVRASHRMEDGRLLAHYEVEDTGIGIAPEHIKKVFDPFFTTKDPGEGTGLGLALCYGIVQDLKGTMTVESTVNIGTRFIIEIPMEGLALAETAEVEPLSTKSGKPRSVP
jgi:two-component system NtrC family sensor kinase